MFRKMRRFKQELPQEMVEKILAEGTNAVLAINGKDGYPYSVPISYVYDDGAIYFHSSVEGLKMELLQENEKVSFCIVDKDEVVSQEYTTYFRSVIAFGRASVIQDPDQKLAALKKLCGKFVPEDDEAKVTARIGKEGTGKLNMVRIDIDHITGKEAIELVNARK